MTLAALLESHDDTALSALASVGLVRRAGRDLKAGKVEITFRDDRSARVVADTQEVSISGDGLAAATCSCPAIGVCRHILLALMALRETSPETGQTDVGPTQSARQELLDLDERDLRSFAGADWDKCLMQAQISLSATLSEGGTNLSVQLPDTDNPVMFLAGAGLKGAVYKGPKTTKRRVVGAAALVLRSLEGAQKLDQLTRDDPEDETLSEAFLQTVREVLEALIEAVFAGGSAVAEETLFDLSISARALAAPRLTGLLRSLVRQARQARDHHVSYTDDRFLADTALTYALTFALQAEPSNPLLTGILRRDYTEKDDLNLILLSAVGWRADNGARGVRLYGFSPENRFWYTTGQARAAGMDLGFRPREVYRSPLWGVAKASEIIGRTLLLERPRISKDRQILWENGQATVAQNTPNLMAALTSSGILFTDWGAARRDYALRTGRGLQRQAAAMPIMLQPSEIGEAIFDDLAQQYHIPFLDKAGRVLHVSIPGNRAAEATWMQSEKSRIAGVVCEVSHADVELRFTPVTVYLRVGSNRSGGLEVCNVTLDVPANVQVSKALGLGARALSFLKSSISSPGTTRPNRDPLLTLCDTSLSAVADALRFGSTDRISALIRRAETMGLKTLGGALNRFASQTTPANALRVAYLAAEISRTNALK